MEIEKTTATVRRRAESLRGRCWPYRTSLGPRVCTVSAQLWKLMLQRMCWCAFVSGVVRAIDRLSTVNSTTYHLVINATDACGLPAYHSTRLIIHALTPVSAAMPRFTATLYSFSVGDLATPGLVIGYLHLITGIWMPRFTNVGHFVNNKIVEDKITRLQTTFTAHFTHTIIMTLKIIINMIMITS